MENERNTFQVEILGTKYVIKSEEDEQYIRELAGYVDAKMQEFVAGRTGIPLQRLLVLAALNIADDLFRARSTNRRLHDAVTDRSAAMLASLEAFEAELTA